MALPLPGPKPARYWKDADFDALVAAIQALQAGGGGPYDMLMFVPGTPSVGGGLLAKFKMVRPVTLPVNLAGSAGDAGTAPSGAVALPLKVNGAQVGTVNIAATTGVVTFTMAVQQALAAGDLLTLWNQAVADPALANLSLTISGTR